MHTLTVVHYLAVIVLGLFSCYECRDKIERLHLIHLAVRFIRNHVHQGLMMLAFSVRASFFLFQTKIIAAKDLAHYDWGEEKTTAGSALSRRWSRKYCTALDVCDFHTRSNVTVSCLPNSAHEASLFQYEWSVVCLIIWCAFSCIFFSIIGFDMFWCANLAE